MEETASFEKVKLNPIELLQEAAELVKKDYWIFVLICLLGILIGTYVPFGILLGPMFCGMYFCYFRLMDGEKVEVGDLFKGFDYFLDSFIVSILLNLLTLVLLVPVYIFFFVGALGLGMASEDGGNGVAVGVFLGSAAIVFLVYLLVLLLVSMLFCFSYHLIVDRGLKAIPAMTTSAKAVWANFGGVLLIFIVNGVLGLIAVALCYLPFFLLAPLILGSITLAYRKIFSDYVGEDEAASAE